MRRTFALTTLLGSALVFVVQPLVARALLPHTGGVPALWNTCIVFSQISLLAGYAWAHLGPRWLGERGGIIGHIGLLALTALMMPPHVDITGDFERAPILRVLAALLVALGLCLPVLAAGAPTIQRWFTRAAPGESPSSLVAASNVGSLGALLAYPTLIEPNLSLRAQIAGFGWAVVAYCALMAVCARALTRPGASGSSGDDLRAATPEELLPAAESAPGERARQWARQVALAFVPSSLMLGVTAHIATDVGSFPMLWVIPLALYLGSFIAAFARPPSAPTPRTVAPFLSLLLLMFLFTAPQVATRLPLVLGHLALFGWCAYLLHGAIARAMPRDASITSFQLSIAVGGALGGAFNSFVAPQLFVRVTEYPLVMALAVLLLPPPPPPPPDPAARQREFLLSVGLDPAALGTPEPSSQAPATRRWLDWMVPLAVGGVAAALFAAPSSSRAPSLVRYGLPLMLLVLASIGHRLRLALGLMAILAAERFDHSVLYASRTFFGVLRVEETRGVRRFLHGTTLHGLQHRSAKHRRTPVAYYALESPIGQLMVALTPALEGRSIGVVGLGVGMLSVYARPSQRWTFYELDPEVVRVARTWFTWLADSAAPHTVVTGDARLRLARDADARYRLLVLDAFSSDAIPTHLLTLEALRLYLQRIDERGVIAFHITNRHLNLEPGIAALARETGLVGYVGRAEVAGPDGAVRTTWIALARRSEHLGAIANDPRWIRLGGVTAASAWTDERSSALSAIRWR